MKNIIIVVIIFLSFSAEADEQKTIKSDYKNTKTKILKSELNKRKVMSSLYEINKRMEKMSFRRGRLTDEMLMTNASAKSLAKSIAALEDRSQAQRALLQKRIRAIYMLGGQGAMRVIFSSASSHQFDKNLKFLKIISDRDFALIKKYKNTIVSLLKKRNKLKKKVTKLVAVKRQLKSSESTLEVQQLSKRALLSKLKRERHRNLNKLKDIKKNSGFSENLFNVSFYEFKGKIELPIKGTVVQPYGLFKDPDYKFYLSHKGIFYAAPRGTPVNTVFPGVVEYVGELPGFGKTVIIDHGDHYYTVYANSTDVEVEEGEKVEEGQQISEVGYSAHKSLYGLYFEIRHFSDAVNPQKWLISKNYMANDTNLENANVH